MSLLKILSISLFLSAVSFSTSFAASSDIERMPQSNKGEEVLRVQKQIKPALKKKTQEELEAKVRSQLPGKASKTKQN